MENGLLTRSNLKKIRPVSTTVFIMIYISLLSGCGSWDGKPTKTEAKRAYALMRYNVQANIANLSFLDKRNRYYLGHVANHKDRYVSDLMASIHKIKCMKSGNMVYSCTGEQRNCAWPMWQDNFCINGIFHNDHLMIFSKGKYYKDTTSGFSFELKYKDGKWVAYD